MVLRRIKDRVRERLHINLNEVGEHDVWQRAELGCAVVSSDRTKALELIDEVVRVAMSAGGAEIVAMARTVTTFDAESMPFVGIDDRTGSGDKAQGRATDWAPAEWKDEVEVSPTAKGGRRPDRRQRTQVARRARNARGADRGDRSRCQDPRVHAPTMLTVAKVEMNVDMAVANVYISIVGEDATADAAIEGLNKAAGFLRGPLGRRLGMQHAPELRFMLDLSVDMSAKLAAIVREDEEKARAAGRDPKAERSSRRKPSRSSRRRWRSREGR